MVNLEYSTRWDSFETRRFLLGSCLQIRSISTTKIVSNLDSRYRRFLKLCRDRTLVYPTKSYRARHTQGLLPAHFCTSKLTSMNRVLSDSSNSWPYSGNMADYIAIPDRACFESSAVFANSNTSNQQIQSVARIVLKNPLPNYAPWKCTLDLQPPPIQQPRPLDIVLGCRTGQNQAMATSDYCLDTCEPWKCNVRLGTREPIGGVGFA